MDLHLLPVFPDGRMEPPLGDGRNKALVVSGVAVDVPASLSPPQEHDLADMLLPCPGHLLDAPGSPAAIPTLVPGQPPPSALDLAPGSPTRPHEEEELLFEKVAVEDEETSPDPTSGLSSLLAACQTIRVRMQTLRVFLPCTDPSDGSQQLHKIHVVVPETARAPDVITLALQQMQAEQAELPPEAHLLYYTNPNFYRLRVAEDENGTIEEDVPALDWNSKVNRLDTLVMSCYDGAETGARNTGKPVRKTLEDLSFLVSYVRQSKTSRRLVRLPPDVLYRELLPVLCARLNKDPKKHQLKLVQGGLYRTSLPDGSQPVDKTLTTLYHTYAVHEFALELQGADADADEAEELDGVPEEDDGRGVLYTEYDACKYQEFHVIKINKWGVRQPRVLGLDRSTIYNMMPTREKTLVGSVRRTQHPDREIEDIEAIRQPDPTRPVYFEIDYKNKQTPMDRIECLSRRDVQELLSKLRFLMELHRPDQQQQRTSLRRMPTTRFLTGVGAFMHTLSDMPDDLVKKLKGELIPTSAEY